LSCPVLKKSQIMNKWDVWLRNCTH
jgi:hypothetical protein